MNWYLQTERMKFRKIGDDDRLNIFDLDSDPEVMRFLTNGQPSKMSDVQTALEKTAQLFKKHKGRFGFWASIEKSTGEFMGWVHFRLGKIDPDNTSRIELGYRFKKNFWGKGYATEGARAFVDHGFNQLQVVEVFAQTMKRNIASQNVMKKIGMTFSREFIDSAYAGTMELDVEYTLTRENWNRLNK